MQFFLVSVTSTSLVETTQIGNEVARFPRLLELGNRGSWLSRAALPYGRARRLEAHSRLRERPESAADDVSSGGTFFSDPLRMERILSDVEFELLRGDISRLKKTFRFMVCAPTKTRESNFCVLCLVPPPFVM